MGYNDLNLQPLQSLPLVPLSQTIEHFSGTPSLAPSLAKPYPWTAVPYGCAGSKWSLYLSSTVTLGIQLPWHGPIHSFSCFEVHLLQCGLSHSPFRDKPAPS